MQQATFAWSGYPQGLHRPKHRLEEPDDSDQIEASPDLQAGTGVGQGGNGVKFSEANLEAANAFVAAAKRRKGNTGKVTLPPDLGPQFEGLSLKANGQPHESAQYSGDSGVEISVPTPLESSQSPTVLQSRGRRPSLTSFDGTRSRRDGTPTVTPSSSPSHRKRSSSRNRARKNSYVNDIDMKPAPRYDPARPHVVFVDSLSDSDENDNTSDADETSGDFSALSTPGNSPTSSDTDDTVLSSSRNSVRPIQMNKRLRDHLRKQAMMQRLGRNPSREGILSSAPPTTSGAGIQERGLILYRPLSFGIVEEPEEGETDAEQANLDVRQPDDVYIQEILAGDSAVPGEQTAEMQLCDTQGMDVDDEMDVDD